MSFVDYFTAVQASSGWDNILQSFARFVALPAGARVLDVGCGPGSLARALATAGHSVVGADRDRDMVTRAQALAYQINNPRPAFIVADILRLPVGAAAFDVVLGANVVFLVSDPLQALREMTRATRPGGLVAMLNPSDKMTVAAAEALADARGLTGMERVTLVNWGHAASHNRRFTLAEVQALFEAAGLIEITVADKVGPGLARFVRGAKPQ